MAGDTESEAAFMTRNEIAFVAIGVVLAYAVLKTPKSQRPPLFGRGKEDTGGHVADSGASTSDQDCTLDPHNHSHNGTHGSHEGDAGSHDGD